MLQVQHAGSSMPRLATLILYVPEVDRGLQDWDEMEGIEEEEEEWDEVHTYTYTHTLCIYTHT